ncbi:MAG TPA: PrsW family intramembrane metalloprotease [Thermoplasmata archaeon]|nr:PrsW family intramembrane metalloprotease [Thermoplasmata archaeon]
MADGTLTLSFLVVLAVSSFALPLVFLGWIRNTERLSREPWFAVLRSFAWGAVFSVLVAILLSLLLLSLLLDVAPLTELLSTRFTDPQAIVAVLVVAPLVEEASKGLGVRSGRRHTDVRVDGLVYGAAAGLGFSATENLFYGLAIFAVEGPSASLVLIAFRSFSSSFLHASATAVTGYGLAKGWLTGRAGAFLPFYFAAVLMHATFNGFASFGELYAQGVGEIAYAIGFAAAAAFAVGAITVVRYKLASHRPHPPG